ncbi:hypothetical protein Ahia01_000009300 [Argonauta hians]
MHSPSTTVATSMVIFLIYVTQPYKAHGNIACPQHCQCKANDTIKCTFDSLPLVLPHRNFSSVSIDNNWKQSANVPAFALRKKPNTFIDTLRITGVNTSRINSNAFKGLGGIKKIILSHSNIQRIEKYSFRDINVNIAFMLLNVSVDTIDSFAFSDINTETFSLYRSTFNTLESGAFNNFNLTLKFIIARCHIHDMHPYAISFGTIEYFIILRSRIARFTCIEFRNISRTKIKTKITCDCHSAWLMNEDIKLEDITCMAPPHLADLNLSQLNKTDVCEDSSVSELTCVKPNLMNRLSISNAVKTEAFFKVLLFVISFLPLIC